METWGRQTVGGRQARPAGAYLVSILQRRKLRHWREPQALRDKLGLALNWAGTSSFIHTFNKYLLSTYDVPGNTFFIHSSLNKYLLSTYFVAGTVVNFQLFIQVFIEHLSFTHSASIYVIPAMCQAQKTDGELNGHRCCPGSQQRESQ